MQRTLRGVGLLVLFVGLLPSCATYGGHHRASYARHSHGGGSGDLVVAVVQLFGSLVFMAAESAMHDEGPADDAERFEAARMPPPSEPPASYPSPPPIVLPPRATLPDPAKRPFDASAARAALTSHDFRDCQARGVPRGWGHASVAFSPSGAAKLVDIDAPTGLSAGAVACLGEHLGMTAVAPFDGAAVTVGTTWFVQ